MTTPTLGPKGGLRFVVHARSASVASQVRGRAPRRGPRVTVRQDRAGPVGAVLAAFRRSWGSPAGDPLAGRVLVERSGGGGLGGARRRCLSAGTGADHERVPPGSSSCGPISTAGAFTGDLTVLPANDQLGLLGVNCSVVGVSHVSTVSSWPLGWRVQPSSSLGSFLPEPGITVQFRPVALNSASLVVRIGFDEVQFWHAWESTKVPLASTSLWASPMFVQPPGGATERHVLVTGL